MPDREHRTSSNDYTRDEKHRDSGEDKQENIRLQVHYPDDLGEGLAPSYKAALPIERSDSGGLVTISSRASSIAGTDGDESEDYDWSGEEDLVNEEAKFEQKMGLKPKPEGWGPKRVATFLFSTLIGSVFVSSLLVAGPILVHFLWYVPHKTAHRRYVLDNVEAWLFWAAANLLISWFLGFIIDIVPVVVRGFISFVWGHVSEYVKSRIEMYNSIKDTAKPVFYAASGWVSWVIIFGGIYKLYDAHNPSDSRASYTQRVFEVVEFLFFFALVISASRMISHFIAFAFHRTAYKERLDTLTEALKVIEVLRNYRPARASYRASRQIGRGFGLFTPFGEKQPNGYFSSRSSTPERLGGNGDGDSPAGAKKGKGKQASRQAHSKSPSASRAVSPSPLAHGATGSPHTYPPGTSPRRSVEDEDPKVAIRAAKALKSAVLHDARNIKGKGSELTGLVWDVTSAHEAKRLARAIYNAFRPPNGGRKYLLPVDFHPAFKTPQEAEAAFRVFDKDNNGDISRAEIKTTLLQVYKERRFLSRSMRDVGQALKTLDQIILFFALVILFFISLSVFGVNVGSSLTSVYTLGIGLSFIFKNSASNAFDAVMFLFVTHPFDTGDRCFIDDENLVVKKMGLFATVFTRADGSETYYFNSLLFTKFITNLRRSGNTFENLTMQVAWNTPMWKLDALEKEINEWLETEENRWFVPNTSITPQKIENQRYLEVTIGIGHNGTWQDWGLRMARKTAFHAAVQHYCKQLGITCYDSAKPIVWADTDNASYALQTPPAVGNDTSPGAVPPSPGSRNGAGAGGEGDYEIKSFNTPVLGFLPPQNERNAVRVRKSKSRKAAQQQRNAIGGGDG
ncbi:hypothetical protein PUNSTDRAFT_65245 [Punctularia strigosozonata HHB-11173 SS5]|uniref:uncharacterized protein n=1 Tax=Punctularia strigosozonata (strain HHB-11173) TaxID=741275 RepID=UPI000441829B|nr:uncharacterized protein PUNSTDRAFT_65245 [Punctularia strigosozonata HHB-11173 SS5]EIN10820.1 hypothetical protein PUNSTDRAFT_65245 [Punctularia strigosozonata HHB-11173 SS5]